jgi:hypothetical protein|tara:strand:+ start:26 stop:166 length:141 start_codon:yes stop_codon:yes gene_type:complete
MKDKKLGRRIAGTYGRLGTKKLKRAASKGIRKNAKNTINHARKIED